MNDSHNAKLDRTWADVPEIYERYFVRYETYNSALPSPFQGGAGDKQHYFNVSILPNFILMPHYNNGHMALTNQSTVMHTCPNGSTDVTCNLFQNVGSFTLTYNTWHCVETHLGQNIAEVWVNGTQTLRYTTNIITPSTYDRIEVYRQGADNQYRYEDDHVVATTRVGCSGSPTADLEAPTPPSGVTIR